MKIHKAGGVVLAEGSWSVTITWKLYPKSALTHLQAICVVKINNKDDP